VVLDADGVAVVEAGDVDRVLEGAKAREDKEAVKRERLQAGELSYEMDGLRAVVEGSASPTFDPASPGIEGASR